MALLPAKTIVAIAFVSVLAYYALRTPDLKPLLRHEAYPARVVRDRWGVPHIFSDTNAGAAFGLGFAHCADYFAEMQLLILAARGKVAEAIGEEALTLDWFSHFLDLPERVTKVYNSQSPQLKQILQGYADGVNHYVASHPSEVLHFTVWPATPVDILVIFFARLYIELGVPTLVNTVVEGMFDERVLSPLWVDFSGTAWALQRLKSAEGNVQLLINSRQLWGESSAVWYEAHISSSEGWKFYGLTPIGCPLFLQGFSTHLGWALTQNHPSSVDLVQLQMKNTTTATSGKSLEYLHDGKWVSLRKRKVKLASKVVWKISWPSTLDFYWSEVHEAPALRTPTGTFVVKMMSVERMANALQQFFTLNLATNLQEWQSGMKSHSIPCFNFIYADATDNIYFTYNVILPIRSPTSGNNNIDLSSSISNIPTVTSEMWKGYLDDSVCVQKLNPPSRWLMNADSTPFNLTTTTPTEDDTQTTSETQLKLYQNEKMTNRAVRLLELLHSEDRQVSEEELLQFKFDEQYHRDHPLVLLRDVVIAFAEKTLDSHKLSVYEKESLHVAKWWNLGADLENKNTALIVLAFTSYLDFLPNVTSEDPAMEIQKFNNTQFLLHRLLSTGNWLRKHFGKVDVPWGVVCHITRAGVSLPMSGTEETLRYSRMEFEWKKGHVHPYSGDGSILFVSWNSSNSNSVQAKAIHPFGMEGNHPESPHYADQLSLFASKRVREVWITYEEIMQNVENVFYPSIGALGG